MSPPIGRTPPIGSRSSSPNHWSGPAGRGRCARTARGPTARRRSSRSSRRTASVADEHAAVPRHDQVLQVADVATQLGPRRRGERVGHAVPPGEVHEAARAHRLGHRRRPRGASHAGHVAAPAGRRDDRIAPDLGAVLERRPPPPTVAAPRSRGAARPPRPHCGPRPRAPPRPPGAATHSNVLRRTSRMARSSSPGRGSPSVGGPRHRRAARRPQRVEHVGEPLAHEHDDAGQEPVRLVHLRRARPLPANASSAERRAGQRVPLEHQHLVTRLAPGPTPRRGPRRRPPPRRPARTPPAPR